MKTFAINGAGLGLRRELLPSLEKGVPEVIDFFEVSPENWIDIGGPDWARFFEALRNAIALE